MPRLRNQASPFRYFNSSPEVIRLVVMMYVRFPLSLRNVEDLLFERAIDIFCETIRYLAEQLRLQVFCKKHGPYEQTSKIVCTKEARVPSTNNGGYPRGTVSISRNLMGVGGAQATRLSGNVFGNFGYL